MHDLSPKSTSAASARWLRPSFGPARYLRADWLHGAVLLLIGFLVRARGLSGERIWDDKYLALANPFIKSPLLILESFRHYLFLDSYSAHYRPIQNISYLFDYFFWNTDPYGFHLTNCLLHASCGVLLYFLLRKLLVSLWLRDKALALRDRAQKRIGLLSPAAFLIALLWSVHPVHSAAVDYISGRADSLAFLFAAAGWLLVFRARAQKGTGARWLFFSLAAVAGLLALCSREIACVWFALFLGHLIFVERSLTARARLTTAVVCLGLIGIYAGLRELPVRGIGPAAEKGWPVPVRLTLMTRSLGDYTRLMFYPGNLHMERSVLDGDSYRSNATWRSAAALEYLSLLGLTTLAALGAGSLCGGRGRSLRAFGAAWFMAGYLPVSNLVSLNATVAEHWLYLPSIGFLIFVAGCAIDLPLRLRTASIVLACLAAAGLSARSLVRSTDWANEETFYTRTIAAGGGTQRAAANLAAVYSHEGKPKEAERVFRRILQIMPDYPSARNNLASLLQDEGRKEEAETLFSSAAKTALEDRKDFPRTWVAAINMAHLKRADGDLPRALQILEQARRDYPETWEIVCAEAEVLRLSQRVDDSIHLVADFARKNWWHYEASLALGRLYAAAGNAELAAVVWRHASRLDVHDAVALNLIASLRLRQDRLSEALESQERAVARQPDEPRQYQLLGAILTKMGRANEAGAAFAQVSQMKAIASAQASLD